MDFWSRLVGGTYEPKRPVNKVQANDSGARLERFRRAHQHVVDLCNRPRNPTSEGPLLENLRASLDRVVTLIREETRAPVPHVCLQFAASNQIYTGIARAATVSRYEPIIAAAVAVFAALIDSEEEDFLSSPAFAKSLMRMVTRIIDHGEVLVGLDTETAILELLFTVAAKIRLQPEILAVWFHSTAKPELEDVFVKEKKSFVGITQRNDFPLCYLLIDRVHHEGRIGDFARTGLLYVFEATGRSLDLEEWVVSSDIPTLMASGLGALYSQLSRELSIIHPDATLPAVLAMSDYSTTHPQATAESAFSEKHRSHMTTFLSYLAFWQDVLDHCRSGDVRQTLLDHFQILFLQQLLYPSLLQSSDTDAGSSVAVLTYMTAMLEALGPDLTHMMLTYLLAIQVGSVAPPSAPTTPVRPSMPPRSPTTLKRRQSLMLLTAPKDPNDAVEPSLFNLVDLVLNSVSSNNSQTAFAALKLVSAIIEGQTQYAFGTLFKVRRDKPAASSRTVGGLELECEKFFELATSLHQHYTADGAYHGLCDDVRNLVEAQVLRGSSMPAVSRPNNELHPDSPFYLERNDPLLRSATQLLSTFFTNSVEVNLALTQALMSVLSCADIRLDGWLAVDPSDYTFSDHDIEPKRAWQMYLQNDENESWSGLQQATQRPSWSGDVAPALYVTLQTLTRELDAVRITVPNLDQLLAGRKKMLQAAELDTSLSEPPTPISSPIQTSFPKAHKPSAGHSRNSSTSSIGRGRNNASDSATSLRRHERPAVSPLGNQSQDVESASLSKRSIFQPPPPETPSTTDVLMQQIEFPTVGASEGQTAPGEQSVKRTSSLNHVLTNAIILQEFAFELAALLQVRAVMLGDREVRHT